MHLSNSHLLIIYTVVAIVTAMTWSNKKYVLKDQIYIKLQKIHFGNRMRKK